MIAPLSRRPYLQVGKYCITSYDGEWLAEALDKAAQAMGGDVSPFRQDLLAGVMHYLEQDCPKRILPLEELFQRIQRMLNHIGLHSLAEELAVSAPPVSIDLGEIAGECPFPLFFFHNLQKELLNLRGSGVSSCTFSGLKECVMSLEKRRRWNAHCEYMAEEILAVINSTWNMPPQLVA